MFHESRAVHTALAVFFSLAVSVAFAAPPLSVNLSSEASRPATNDLMQVTLSAEAVGATLADLSGQINQTLAGALKLAKAYPTVKVQSGGTNTYPIYAQDPPPSPVSSRGTIPRPQPKAGGIESWHMRSSLFLESSDTVGLSELIGKLQTSMAVSSLNLLPSPETARKAEDAAILDALALFKARAKLLADAQGKNYSIRELSVSTRGGPSPVRMLRAASADLTNAAPMPIESGESTISASVSGKIEIE